MAQQESTTRQAQDAAREVKEHAEAGAEAVQRGAEAQTRKWTSQVGARGQTIAEAVSTAGERLRGKEDWLAEGADAVSRHLARLSEAARSKEPAELKSDLERFARERPAVFLGATVIAGLALGRVLRSSASTPQPGEPTSDPAAEPSAEASAGRHSENRSF